MRDKDVALVVSLTAQGFEAARIMARAPLENALLLDRAGSGVALVGTATHNGEPARFAAVVTCGSLDGSPRTAGAHVFAAPEPAFAALGGWLVPGAFWFLIDPAKAQRGPRAESGRPDAVQARTLAQAADVFIRQFVSDYTASMQGMISQLGNTQQILARGVDTNCTLRYATMPMTASRPSSSHAPARACRARRPASGLSASPRPGAVRLPVRPATA